MYESYAHSFFCVNFLFNIEFVYGFLITFRAIHYYYQILWFVPLSSAVIIGGFVSIIFRNAQLLSYDIA